MAYSNVIVTDAGNNLRARVVAKEVRLKFTKVETSSHIYGYTTDAEWKALTDLLDVQQTTEIGRVAVNNQNPNQVDLYYQLLNTEVTTSYNIQVYGVYAEDPDGGDDVLFAITYAISDPQPVPAFDNIPFIIMKTVSITFSDTENVEIFVNFTDYVTRGELEDYIANIDFSNLTDVYFVSANSSSQTEDGTILNPFKQISTAILEAAQNDNFSTILVGPGMYDGINFGNITFPAGKRGLSIRGIGGAYGTQIESMVLSNNVNTLGGTLQIDSFYIETLDVGVTSGSHSFQFYNCVINQLTYGNGVVGNYNFLTCRFQTTIQLRGNSTIINKNCSYQDGVFVYILPNTTGETTLKVEFAACDNVLIDHSAGTTIASQGTRFGSSSGIGLVSTAAGEENPVILLDCTFLQTDRTYARIQLGNSTSYYIASTIREPLNDVMNKANRLGGGFHTDDVYDHQAFTNISPSSEILSDILAAFDGAIGTVLADTSDLGDRIGQPTDTASLTGQTLFALIKGIADKFSNVWTDARAALINSIDTKTTTIQTYTATNNTASATGTLSQKSSAIYNILNAGGIAGTVRSVATGTTTTSNQTVTITTPIVNPNKVIVIVNGTVSSAWSYSYSISSTGGGNGTNNGRIDTPALYNINSTGVTLYTNRNVTINNTPTGIVFSYQIIEFY